MAPLPPPPKIPPLLAWLYDLSLTGAVHPSVVYTALGRLLRMQTQCEEAPQQGVTGDFARYLRGEVTADQAKAFIRLCTHPLMDLQQQTDPGEPGDVKGDGAQAAPAVLQSVGAVGDPEMQCLANQEDRPPWKEERDQVTERAF